MPTDAEGGQRRPNETNEATGGRKGGTGGRMGPKEAERCQRRPTETNRDQQRPKEGGQRRPKEAEGGRMSPKEAEGGAKVTNGGQMMLFVTVGS